MEYPVGIYKSPYLQIFPLPSGFSIFSRIRSYTSLETKIALSLMLFPLKVSKISRTGYIAPSEIPMTFTLDIILVPFLSIMLLGHINIILYFYLKVNIMLSYYFKAGSHVDYTLFELVSCIFP